MAESPHDLIHDDTGRAVGLVALYADGWEARYIIPASLPIEGRFNSRDEAKEAVLRKAAQIIEGLKPT